MTIQEYRIIKPNEYQHDGWDADTMTFIGTIAGDIIGSAHELKGPASRQQILNCSRLA